MRTLSLGVGRSRETSVEDGTTTGKVLTRNHTIAKMPAGHQVSVVIGFCRQLFIRKRRSYA